MKFKVIDLKTGQEAAAGDLAFNEDWAGELMWMDMEGFAITANGDLILCDECGRFVYCPEGRFEVVEEVQDGQ